MSELLTVVIFMAAIGALSLCLFVLPKKDWSRLEFRPLKDDPFKGRNASALVGELMNGKLSSNIDGYLEDHYPARDFFIALNSYFLRLTGRNADQTVVWGSNERLFPQPLEETDYLNTNIGRINEFAAKTGMKTAVVAVPTSASVVPEDLPAVHYEYRDAELIEKLRGSTDAYVPDLIALFKESGAGESLMYRTDHHWTMDGACLCVNDLLAYFGNEPVSKADFTVTGYEFYGYYYRNAGLWLTKPDTLEVWRNDALDSAKVTIGAGVNAETYTGVYDGTKLIDGEIDRYAAYLYSNNGLTVVENPEGNGETVMLVKDSFGNSIAVLLASVYSRVVMIDTRYMRDPNLPLPSELAAEYGIEKLIVVLGLDSVVSDVTIGTLR